MVEYRDFLEEQWLSDCKDLEGASQCKSAEKHEIQKGQVVVKEGRDIR